MERKYSKILSLVIVLTLLLGSISAYAEQHLYGEFADVVTNNKKTVFIRSYLLMDCCEEWGDFCKLVASVENASSAEGLEFYEYNKKGRMLKTKDEVEVFFHPTEEFAEKPYDSMKIVSLFTGNEYEVEELEDGSFRAVVKESGIFAFVKLEEDPPEEVWISNIPDCNGECRSCSDDW